MIKGQIHYLMRYIRRILARILFDCAICRNIRDSISQNFFFQNLMIACVPYMMYNRLVSYRVFSRTILMQLSREIPVDFSDLSVEVTPSKKLKKSKSFPGIFNNISNRNLLIKLNECGLNLYSSFIDFHTSSML